MQPMVRKLKDIFKDEELHLGCFYFSSLFPTVTVHEHIHVQTFTQVC